MVETYAKQIVFLSSGHNVAVEEGRFSNGLVTRKEEHL